MIRKQDIIRTKNLILLIPVIKPNIGIIRLEAADYYTKVPPRVMITLIKRMARRMCNGTMAAEMLSMEKEDQGEVGYYQDQESNPTYSSYKAQYRNN